MLDKEPTKEKNAQPVRTERSKTMNTVMKILKSWMCTIGEAYSHREEAYNRREEEECFLDRADDLLVSIRQELKSA